MGVLVPRTLTADPRPCPPLSRRRRSPHPCLRAGFGRYCTYSAGFTQFRVSRYACSQWCGYFAYPAHTCRTRENAIGAGGGFFVSSVDELVP